MDWWLDDGDVRLAHGSALDVLAALPAGSVQTCVTSPPYWGLRDYGTGEWTGGDPNHDHDTQPHRNGRGGSGAPGKQTAGAFPSGTAAAACACGARRVDAQLGLEPTPGEYVESMVAVFREVWRVLRDDGTLWLNLGDSYANDGKWGGSSGGKHVEALHGATGIGRGRTTTGLKAKDLVGIPWRVAFALQADGWYLRSDIVWSKPNPMPESVTDRPTKAHEYVFLLAKQPRYFYDADAIREPHMTADRPGPRRSYGGDSASSMGEDGKHKAMTGAFAGLPLNEAGRNARSVWDIATQPTPEAHFATFPMELARRCILAGTSEAGECSACGAPWQRQVERELVGGHYVPNARSAVRDGKRPEAQGGIYEGARLVSASYQTTTTGWAASCGCGAPARPQTVLDPFIGSGTTALVARRHGRRSIGVDLNAEYLAIAARRTAQLSLLAGGGGA